MHSKDRKDVPIALVEDKELMSIIELEKDLGDKYYLIAYERK